jgi:hypothetical protein
MPLPATELLNVTLQLPDASVQEAEENVPAPPEEAKESTTPVGVLDSVGSETVAVQTVEPEVTKTEGEQDSVIVVCAEPAAQVKPAMATNAIIAITIENAWLSLILPPCTYSG